ncbi:hypothetical protein IJ182_03215 [bacterium]|nr:hypothetical protein [bacterium]
MKKIFTILSIIGIISTYNIVYADAFDEITGITPVQKQKLNQIQYDYNQKSTALDARINEYTNKMNLVEKDTDKTPEQISLLKGAYERNLTTLKAQQKVLKKETDTLYKNILTEEQYKQYITNQTNVQDAFRNFVQK